MSSFAQQWNDEDYANKLTIVDELIHSGHALKAMKEVVDIEKHAQGENSRYGFYVTNELKGHLYITSKEYTEAIKYFSAALHFADNPCDSIDVYTDMMECCCLENNYDKANNYQSAAAKIISSYKNSNNNWVNDQVFMLRLFYFNVQRCNLYYNTNNEKKFRNAFNQLKKHPLFKKRQEDDVRLQNIYRFVLVDKDPRRALKYCIDYWPNSHYDLRASLYEMMGRYLEATNAWNDNFNYNDTVLSKSQQKDIDEIAEEIGNNKLMASNENMSLDNTTLMLDLANLRLSKTRLAFDQLKQSRLLHKAQLANGKYQIEKRNAELAEIKASNAKQKFEQQAQKNMERRKNLILIASIIIGVLFTLLLLFAVYLYTKQKNRLHDKNLQLQNAMRQLEDSEARKANFFQQVSHEVRTPLNAIMGFTQVLAFNDEEEDSDDTIEMKQIINNHIDVMKSLLKDVMGLSILENDTLQLQMEAVNVNASCQANIDDIRSRCADSVKLLFTSDLGDNNTITTCGKMYNHIISNLLSNAVKNTTEGSITVNAYTDNNIVCISVTDTGCGIPEDKREAIFERFVKVDEFKQGFGLGLSLGRDYARLLGGDVILDPSYTGGARFVYNTGKPCNKQSTASNASIPNIKKTITAVLLLLITLTASAQRNTYGVKDALVPLCREVENNKYSSNAFMYVDSLLKESQRYGDIKAEAFAYISYVDAKYIHRSADFDSYCLMTQKFAHNHNFPMYYYEAAYYEIKKLSRDNKELAAFRKSNKYLKQAIIEKYAYGQALMLRTFAESKYLHGEYSSAIPLFKNTLKFELEHIHEPDMNPVNTYMQLGRSFLYSYHYPEAETYLLSALKYAKTPALKFEILALLSQSAFLQQDKVKFFAYYNKMQQASSDPKLHAAPFGRRVKIDNLLMNDKPSEAYALCMAEGNERTRNAFLCDYYIYKKDYSNLLDVTKKMKATYSFISSMERRRDIADFVSMQDKELLNMEADRLKLDHDQLTLRNTNIEWENAKLELDRARAKELVEKTNYKNTQLLLKKRDTELRKIKLENEHKAKQQEEYKAQQKFLSTILKIAVIFFAIVLVILAFMAFQRLRAIRILRDKNAELTDTLQRKKEADAIKDKYIAKTGLSLSDPINALTELSQKIAAINNHLSMDEKMALNEEIQQNSERIIELLDNRHIVV